MRLGRAATSMGRKRRPKQEPVQEETIIEVRDEYMTLSQLLKAAGIVGSGGEAKAYLADTAVQVNGGAEQRRGRKLRPGDVIIAPGAPPIRLVPAPDESLERI